MKLIVGLGNPGLEYNNNRHNTGFMCVNYLAKKQGIKLDKKQGKARVGAGRIDSEEVVLARPQTFMNNSGQAVRPLVERYRIKLDELIVIHDDLDLPVGKIRIKQGGGAGGHNGIKSIVADLGSPDFIRVRVGIGRPVIRLNEDQIIDWVLTCFDRDEKQAINETIPLVSDAVISIVTEGLEKAMNRYN